MILTRQNWFYLLIIAVLLTALTALKFCHPQKITVQPSIVSKHTIQNDTVVRVRRDTVKIPVIKYRLLPATSFDTGYCPNFAVNWYTEHDTIIATANCKKHQLENVYISQKPLIVWVADTITRFISNDSIIQTIYQDIPTDLVQVHGGGEYSPLDKEWNVFAKAGIYFTRFNLFAKPSVSHSGLSAYIGAEVRLF